jgi:hypothetical protein
MTHLAADAPPARDRTGFIAANTALLPVPLVPEIRLHLAHEAVPMWQKTEEELGEIGLPPPFWAFAWAGGQALARIRARQSRNGARPQRARPRLGLRPRRHRRETGRRGKRPGRRHRRLRARRDRAQRGGQCRGGEHHRRRSPGHCRLPPSIPSWWATCSTSATLRRGPRLARSGPGPGSLVLIGDPGRSYLPKHRLASIAEYSVPQTRELEDAETKRSAVWRLL